MTWGQLGDNLIRTAEKQRLPLIGQFELTARCNLRCKMCYVCCPVNDKAAIDKERSAKEWIKLSQEAINSGMLYILLTGGEVFIRKDFKTIYEEISMMGFNVQIYTNGTMITPQIAQWLGQIPPSKCEVTLYGAAAETYDNICGDASGFQRTLRGIDLLQSEGITVVLKTTVVKGNSNEFMRMAEIAESRGIYIGTVNYISPRREGANTYPEAERLSPEELIQYDSMVANYYKDKAKEISSTSPAVQDNKSIVKAYDTSVSNQATSPFRCTAGKCSLWVTWDGRMLPCGLMNEPAEYPFEHGLNNSWKAIQERCMKIPVSNECMQCNYKEQCMTCPARLKNETGFYDKAASYLCEIAKLNNQIRIELGTSKY